MKIRFLILTCAILFLSACAAPTPAPPTLADTKWTLQSMTQNGAVQTPAAGTNVTLVFSRDGRVSGNAGCNSFGGSFETQGEILKISSLTTTLMACLEPNAMNFEAAYLAALQNAQLFERRNNQLTITFANGNGKLVFTSS